MKSVLLNAVCAIALTCAGVTVASPRPAQAQVAISFAAFHDRLAAYGDWVYSDRWGEVWIPDVSSDFQPYDTDGYWADTDYGWTWVSDYAWGDIPFHYGRWVDDPDDGWLWIPGYVWSPAWVVWRAADDMIGWMPCPPDARFLAGVEVSGGGLSFGINFNDPGDYYGYRRWYGPSYSDAAFANMWVFVGAGHMADRNFRDFRAPRDRNMRFIHNGTNITNYTVVNNMVVNRSVRADAIERAGGRHIQPVQASQVLRHADLVTHVDQGRRVQEAMRAQAPHGNGAANSAPAPSQAVVSSLSNKAPPHRGQGTPHVFTQQTVQQGGFGRGTLTPAAPAGWLRSRPPQQTQAEPQRQAPRDDGSQRFTQDRARAQDSRAAQPQEMQRQDQMRQAQQHQDEQRAAQQQQMQQRESQMRQAQQQQMQHEQQMRQAQAHQDQQREQQMRAAQQQQMQRQDQMRQAQQQQMQQRQEEMRQAQQQMQQRQGQDMRAAGGGRPAPEAHPQPQAHPQPPQGGPHGQGRGEEKKDEKRPE